MHRGLLGITLFICLSACAIPVGKGDGERFVIIGFGMVDMPARPDDSLQVETTVVGATIPTGKYDAASVGYSSYQRLYTPPNFAWIKPDPAADTIEPKDNSSVENDENPR